MKCFNEKYIETMEWICKDFDYFCSYLVQNKVKLSNTTGMIGKKACFEINQKMYRREKYERMVRLQEAYPVIHFMHYVAFSFRILDIDHGYIVFGSKYDAYKKASTVEKYLLFFTCFLYDGTCWGHNEYLYLYNIYDLLLWVIDENEKEQNLMGIDEKEYIISARKFGMYDNSTKSIIPMLEELGLIHLLECIKKGSFVDQCRIKVFPLMNLMASMFNEIVLDDENEMMTEDIIQNYLKEYTHYIESEQNSEFVDSLFQEEEANGTEYKIILEISIRHYKCSREILFSSKNTLEEVHLMIQKAFEFGDDHLYAFYLGKGCLRKCYYMDEATTNVNELFAKDFKLGDLHLHEGSQFEYLFDFGDCWWFDIRVKRYSEGHQKNPEIIVIKGEAPLQYPEFY